VKCFGYRVEGLFSGCVRGRGLLEPSVWRLAVGEVAGIGEEDGWVLHDPCGGCGERCCLLAHLVGWVADADGDKR
jgi:hypothetical protein